tara:strand:+ start:359 stop:1900 length:1542 start_codon:yes stop_codon:yes gene_type:complete
MGNKDSSIDLSAEFAEAGWDVASFDFSPKEKACISAKLKKMKDEDKPQDQKVAIAISHCAPSKAKKDFAASFDAEGAGLKIKIKGANYEAVDTGDGYFTLKDVPILSEVPKGVKNAPESYDKEKLEDCVRNSLAQYHDGPNHRCAPAFVRHNPDTDLGNEPDFSGYVLPNRVGKYNFGKDEKWTVFGDVKVNGNTFQKLQRGELPAHSPELSYKKGRITGLAFLSTKPPHFEFANNTIGEVKVDHAAQFAASLGPDDRGKFDMEEKSSPSEGGERAEVSEEAKMESSDITARFAALETVVKDLGSKVSEIKDKLDGRKNIDPIEGKPENTPIEPDGEEGRTKMEMTPELAAKFSALENDNAELKNWRKDQENEKIAASLMKEAEASLTGKIVTDELREQIASFAAEKAGQEGASEWFNKYLEALKPSLREIPSANFSDFAASGVSVEATDGTLAKYQGDPEKAEKATQFALEYRTLKKQSANFGANWGSTEEEREEKYIEQQLALSNETKEGR